MKRTTISLPDDVAAALEREARRCGQPVSQVAREAIEVRLGLAKKGPKKLSFIGLVDSGYTTISRDMEEILQREWGQIDRDR